MLHILLVELNGDELDELPSMDPPEPIISSLELPEDEVRLDLKQNVLFKISWYPQYATVLG
jgi:hypothetical protein